MSGLLDFFSYNRSVLSGAMDIIIVRQPDDSYKITPFRIRFGSFRVFRAKEKTVNILINGQKIDLTMRLSECGEAYFINEIHKVVDDSNYLSDCYSPAETGNSAPSSPILKLNQKEKIDVEPLSLDNSEKPKDENVETEKNQTKTELDGTKSDQQSEINLQVNEINDTTCLNTSVQEKEDKLSYNNDFSIGREDCRIRKMSFDVLSRDENFYKFRMIRENSFCIESTKKFNNKIKIELSNSWNLISKSEENVENLFDCKKVTKDEYFRDPWKILNSKELAFKYDDHIYTWKVIAPMIFSQLAFGEDLPTNVLTSLTQNSEGFFIWKKVNLDAFKIDIKKRKENEKLKIEKSKLHLESSPVKEEIQNEKLETNHISLDEVSRKLETTNTANIYNTNNTNNTNNINSLSSNPIEPNPTPDSKKKEIHRKLSIQYRKTYILTSDQIRSLNLSKGRNEISFVVSSRYQGTHVLSSEIYLFDSDDKIVISDLDGTITRSDVLGHVLPYFGKDWSHKGVVKLFNKISEHGYKIVYLTARSISQSDQTKNYLRNKLIQNNMKLPDGPILMSPDGLVSSFKRELIDRIPQSFKIECLTQLVNLFPPDNKPYFAGFGNRTTDAIAYEAVGISRNKIFLINEKGEITQYNHCYKTSYLNINEMVYEMFPPLTGNNTFFGNINYFKPNYKTIDVKKLFD